MKISLLFQPLGKIIQDVFKGQISEVEDSGFLDVESLYIDGTHIKADANSHKYKNEVIKKEARSYEKELQEEIEKDHFVYSLKEPFIGSFFTSKRLQAFLNLY